MRLIFVIAVLVSSPAFAGCDVNRSETVQDGVPFVMNICARNEGTFDTANPDPELAAVLMFEQECFLLHEDGTFEETECTDDFVQG